MDVSGKLIQKQLELRLVEMKALLEELVNIDSGSLDKEGVNQVASVLVPRLERLGFTVRRTQNEECGDFVVASKKLDGKGRVVILGHMDTVWPRGTVNKWPYKELDENIATGPGVGDMKGGLVMALFALEELLKSGFNQLQSIEFVLVPDEEIGSVYSREKIEKVVDGADAVLVLEPGRPGNGVVTARGALGNLFIKARGEEAHCAVNYEEGASAVRALAMKVDDLERLSLPKQGTIVNVGVFTGGVAKQVVPEFAELNVDVRARTNAAADELLKDVYQIAKRADVDGVEVVVEGGLTRPPFTSVNNRELFFLAEEISKELDFPVFEVEPTGGGSDGNFSAALGIPTIDGLGPVSHDICSRKETMEIGTLASRGAIFHELIRRIGILITNKK